MVSVQFIILCLTAFLFTSVSGASYVDAYGREKEVPAPRKVISTSLKNKLLKVLRVNEDLHGAFFKYNAKNVEKYAKQLRISIEKIKDASISKKTKPVIKNLISIKASAERKSNNESYYMVSKVLTQLVKAYNLGSKYDVYSCPMVKKEWVQNSEKKVRVHNPYAPEMPYCGTRDTYYKAWMKKEKK